MKNEILNKGLDATIERKRMYANSLIIISNLSVLIVFILAILLINSVGKTKALEHQIEQRDAKIANLEATNNELLFDLKQKYFTK
jgi:cell division protein FtsB